MQKSHKIKNIIIVIVMIIIVSEVKEYKFIEIFEIIPDVKKQDISYTYQILESNTYKIYPGHISNMKREEGQLRIEYLKSGMKVYSEKMRSTDVMYGVNSGASGIIYFDIPKTLTVDLGTSYGEGIIIHNLEGFIVEWELIRQLCLDNEEYTDQYLIDFEVVNQTLTHIRIASFDVENQDTALDYPSEYARDCE